MSSIISDIFYGSKQNIIDNYLINRHQFQQPSSVAQQEPSAIYTPFIQLTITPRITEPLTNQHFLVRVQMGTKTDENIIEFIKGADSAPSVMLILNDLEKQDLNKQTNIKLVISEGKYKNKAFSYIPIETIKSLVNHNDVQKHTSLQLKGKHFIGFKTVDCTIRAEFPSNTILNSQILKSQYSSNSKHKDRRRQNDRSQNSQKSYSYWDSHEIINKQTRPHQRRSPLQKRISPHRIKQSSNIFVQSSNINMKSYKPGRQQQPICQYMGQIGSIRAIFSQLNLKEPLLKQTEITLINEQQIISLDQVVQLKNFNKQGLRLKLTANQQILGSIHLSPLLLTLHTITGELPIFSLTQQCLGTIKINSPLQLHHTTQSPKKPENAHNQSQKELTKSVKGGESFLVMNLEKIILINSCNILDNDSSFNNDPSLWQQFDFSTMEALDRLEIIARIEGQSYKFGEIAMKYLVNKDQMRIVELRRKQGLFANFKGSTQEQINIQIQIYSNYRLISYSSLTVSSEAVITNHFVGGQTNFSHCHCSIHLQTFNISFPEDLFQSSHIKILTPVVEDLLTSKIVLSDTSDESIKKIMNFHKKATYIVLKKFMTILIPLIPALFCYQNSKFGSILGQNYENSEHFIQFASLMLRQVTNIDTKGEQSINKEQFDRILNFYRSLYLSYESKQMQKLSENVICNDSNQVIYPFFISGYYLQKAHTPEIPQELPPESEKQPIKIERPQIKEIAVLAQPFYYLQKLTLFNAHLLNNGKIPNCTLSISKKVHYSNANPEFFIEKQINLMEPIIIYHRNVAHNQLTVLAEIHPSRRQIHYSLDLTGKATSTLLWGV